MIIKRTRTLKEKRKERRKKKKGAWKERRMVTLFLEENIEGKAKEKGKQLEERQ